MSRLTHQQRIHLYLYYVACYFRAMDAGYNALAVELWHIQEHIVASAPDGEGFRQSINTHSVAQYFAVHA